MISQSTIVTDGRPYDILWQ